MKSELVSIVIPVYNGEEYLAQAIECALSQTYSKKEVIVIDDASTDSTPHIARAYPVIYHRNPQNMERSYSRNRGVELSKGEFIFFLDHDDLWEKDYIESSVEFLREYPIVYSFPRKFINSQGELIRVSRKKLPEDSLVLLFSGLMGYPSATAFRRSAFLGYGQDYIMREDWEILLRSYLNGLSLKVLDNNKVFIREHAKRTSKDRKFLNATYKVYQDYKNRAPEAYLPYFLFHVGETALRFGDLKKGWSLIAQAFLKKPSILKDKRRLWSVIKRGFRFWRA
ncbi:glycosyltransferase family 2 protein [Thermocrinis sp.]